MLVPEPFRDKECPFSGVTKSGRVWRKVPESDARGVTGVFSWKTSVLLFALLSAHSTGQSLGELVHFWQYPVCPQHWPKPGWTGALLTIPCLPTALAKAWVAWCTSDNTLSAHSTGQRLGGSGGLRAGGQLRAGQQPAGASLHALGARRAQQPGDARGGRGLRADEGRQWRLGWLLVRWHARLRRRLRNGVSITFTLRLPGY